MGTGTALEYFQKLEQLTNHANLRDDTSDCGHMVEALKGGVPPAYIKTIYDIGIWIPEGYNEWKKQIITMNQECQRKHVHDQMHTGHSSSNQRNNNASNQKTSNASAANILGDKKMGTGIIYGGQGKPMDIDAMHKKGLCFGCGEKGHLNKDCPKKQKKAKVRAVKEETKKDEGKEELASTSKVEEVKDYAGK